MTRRDLLIRAVASTAGLAGLRAAAGAPPAPADDGFDFLLLGDTHYDRLDQHDLTWLEQGHHGDVRQVRNYSRITAEVLPGLLDELRAQVRANPRIRFVAHVGDLVEGLAGSPALARKQAEDAVACFTGAGLGVPFVFVKGNHDITGPGAPEAYDQVLLPWTARQTGQTLTSGCFTTQQDEALFVWFDAYRPDSLPWLRAALAGRVAKHLFFCLHPPVVPCSARSTWIVYGKPKEADQRAELLELLGRHRAIVLCGHVHKYATLVRDTPAGPFCQATLLSVVPDPKLEPRDRLEGATAYVKDLPGAEQGYSPETLAERAAALAAEAPHVRGFEYADATGYALVSVRSNGVVMKHYTGLGQRCWRTVNLAELVGAT